MRLLRFVRPDRTLQVRSCNCASQKPQVQKADLSYRAALCYRFEGRVDCADAPNAVKAAARPPHSTQGKAVGAHTRTSLCFSLRVSKMRRLLSGRGVGCLREHLGGTFRSIVWQAEIGCSRFTRN